MLLQRKSSVRCRAMATTMLTCVLVVPLAPSIWAADVYTKAPPSIYSPQTYMPAVDGVNWKAAGLGGVLADRTIYGGTGSVSMPLGGQYGLQLDGGGGSYDSRGRGRRRAFVLARSDPWIAGPVCIGNVLGPGRRHQSRSTGSRRRSLFRSIDMQGIVGVEGGSNKSETHRQSDPDLRCRDSLFRQINLGYYVNDNWKVFVGHRYVGGKNALALGTELAFRVNGPVMGSLFVEGRVGENDFTGVWGGRAYGGQEGQDPDSTPAPGRSD